MKSLLILKLHCALYTHKKNSKEYRLYNLPFNFLDLLETLDDLQKYGT
jgi:hypothetical protein